MTSASPVGAHLVGSIPVDTAEEAFALTVEHLGGHVKRIPDGEVGERDTWIRWQYAKIAASEQMQTVNRENTYVPVPPFGIVDGVESPSDIEIKNLGYADAAIESYAVFERLTNAGLIPDHVRFQVGLPAPLSVAIFYVVAECRLMFEQAYGQALKNELSRMLESIPAGKLAIQWETVSEFGLLEGLMDNHMPGDLLENITDRVSQLAELIPEPAEVGLHLCYGDSGHKHFCEPADAGYLTSVANGICRKTTARNIGWIHMPVPKERDDDAYFAPLSELQLPETTDLYLGLVHQTGGIEGTRRRIDTASRAVERFGVATECGLGRRDPASIPELLQQHRKVSGVY